MRYESAVVLVGCLLFLPDIIEVNSISPKLLEQLTRKQQSDVECTLPPYPKHGKWKVLGGKATPGDTVPEDSVIVFQCDLGFKLSTKMKHLYCDEEWDSRELPTCEELCPPLYSSTTYKLKCRDEIGDEVKCTEASDGTVMDYTCAPYYETPFGHGKTSLCRNKKWNRKPLCLPICGRTVSVDARTLIYGSRPNDKLEYPWIVALYHKSNDTYRNVCGGSILSATVVLTAAHCVTNEYGDDLSAEHLAIGAGKLFSAYKASEDKRAQYLDISKVIIHPNYKGSERRFLGDIAVLVTAGEFTFNEAIQPICFNNLQTIHLHPPDIGEVSGWGRAEGNVNSEVLRTLKIPYKHEVTCAQELPKHFAFTYNMEDKICAGFVEKNTSVCDGDSGSGFAFMNPDDNRYYIHGVVSLGPRDEEVGHCDIQQNTLYTKVAHYYQFVENLLTQYSPKIKDCKLPSHPKNGKWMTDQEDLKPGDIVPSDTVLVVECKDGYSPSSASNSTECGSSFYLATCQKLCPKLNLPNDTFSQCTNENGQAIHCSEAVDGSSLTYACPALYRTPPGTTGERKCVNGEWEPSEPKCIRTTENCGTPKTEGKNGFKYPWTAGIFKKDNSTGHEYTYICGATIISYSAVLTAAQCVTDDSGNVLPKENYYIAAGKVYAKFNDTRDLKAEYRKVLHIITHPSYLAIISRPSDIALLFLSTSFVETNEFIQPVCLPSRIDKKLQINDTGTISGWHLEETGDFEETEELAVTFTGNCTTYLYRYSGEFYIGEDKFCVHFDNGDPCIRPTDIGRGFYHKNPEDGRYYVHGVVSTKPPKEETCEKIFVTKTLFYYDFIDCLLSKFLLKTRLLFLGLGK